MTASRISGGRVQPYLSVTACIFAQLDRSIYRLRTDERNQRETRAFHDPIRVLLQGNFGTPTRCGTISLSAVSTIKWDFLLA
jgi:hypothetical protein